MRATHQSALKECRNNIRVWPLPSRKTCARAAASDQGENFMQVVLLVEAKTCVNVKLFLICAFFEISVSSSYADSLDFSSTPIATPFSSWLLRWWFMTTAWDYLSDDWPTCWGPDAFSSLQPCNKEKTFIEVTNEIDKCQFCKNDL